MTAFLLLAVFTYVAGSGPAFDGQRERRRARRALPAAIATDARACPTCGRFSCPIARYLRAP